MCCGKNRQLLEHQVPQTIASDPPDRTASEPEVLVTGDKPMLATAPFTYRPGQFCVFEYTGNTPLIAVGGVTRARYYFCETSRRLRVDARDRDLLSMLKGLVEVDNND